jgi:flagellar motor protein MotB
MSRARKKGLAQINTEGWMMSYADMATILLAMFIVLSTLGQDQTGASLQKGLESWREATQCFGMPGLFKSSAQPTPLGQADPRYNVTTNDTPEGPPLPSQKQWKTLDQEQEAFQQFLGEMGRHLEVERMPRLTGQATLDFYGKLGRTAPLLTAEHRDGLRPLVPLLERGDYRVVVVVWATMVKESAMQRAADQARQVSDELAAAVGLDRKAQSRLVSVGQPWGFANFQRPVFSLVVARTEAPATGP